MAETLSYQPETTTETIETTLTPEEQDSLAVGEKLQGDQEALLAGKYKDAAELEKAYIELQKKLGDNGEEDRNYRGQLMRSRRRHLRSLTVLL